VNSLPSPEAASPVTHPSSEPPISQAGPEQEPDPVLCGHCGRTASNGLVCIGMCVADSGY
jgi:hypothetical protein